MSRLKDRYQTEVVTKLREEFKLANVHEVPKIEKVVINVGLGRAQNDARAAEVATTTLRKITGQQPLQTVAKKSIAGFKLREGAKIGLKVTLRGQRMYEFLDRLINLVLPRIRDFHGVKPQAFDRQGNYSVGIMDQSVFPELSYDDTVLTHGLQVNIITNSTSVEANRRMLELLGFPFERKT